MFEFEFEFEFRFETQFLSSHLLMGHFEMQLGGSKDSESVWCNFSHKVVRLFILEI